MENDKKQLPRRVFGKKADRDVVEGPQAPQNAKGRYGPMAEKIDWADMNRRLHEKACAEFDLRFPTSNRA